jgi:hypothetical protein
VTLRYAERSATRSDFPSSHSLESDAFASLPQSARADGDGAVGTGLRASLRVSNGLALAVAPYLRDDVPLVFVFTFLFFFFSRIVSERTADARTQS